MAEIKTAEELYEMSDEEFEKALEQIVESDGIDTATEADESPLTDELAINNLIASDKSGQPTIDDITASTSASVVEEQDKALDEDDESDVVKELKEAPLEQPIEESKGEINNQVETYRIRAQKQDYTLTLDELKNLASKGIDYTKKTQQFKEYLPAIEALKANGIRAEDTNLFIDLMKGNKEAFKSLIARHGIDVMDLDNTYSTDDSESKEYVPTEYRPDYAKAEMNEVVARISSEPEYQQTLAVVQGLDDTSKEFIRANPSVLESIQADIRLGDYKVIADRANSIALRDNFSKPVLEYYAYAAKLIGQERIQQSTQAQTQTEQSNVARTANRTKAAIPTQANTARAHKQPANAAEEIYSMSDEEFEKYLQTLN